MKVVNKEAATGHLKVTLCQELRSYDQKEMKLVSKFMKELDSNGGLLFFIFSMFYHRTTMPQFWGDLDGGNVTKLNEFSFTNCLLFSDLY